MFEIYQWIGFVTQILFYYDKHKQVIIQIPTQ